jgi:hypothetical protein
MSQTPVHSLALVVAPVPKLVRVRSMFPKEIVQDLELYTRAYAENGGAEMTPEKLVPMMVEAFLEKDRGFQAARKKFLEAPEAPPVGAASDQGTQP